jgi:hypothetical protein
MSAVVSHRDNGTLMVIMGPQYSTKRHHSYKNLNPDSNFEQYVFSCEYPDVKDESERRQDAWVEYDPHRNLALIKCKVPKEEEDRMTKLLATSRSMEFDFNRGHAGGGGGGGGGAGPTNGFEYFSGSAKFSIPNTLVNDDPSYSISIKVILHDHTHKGSAELRGCFKSVSSYKFKLTAILLVRDSACYLEEWLEHLFFLGFDHVFVYDHFNEERESLEIFKRYIAQGLITVFPWRLSRDLPWRGTWDRLQIMLYNDALYRFRSEWMFVGDADEFPFLPSIMTPRGSSPPSQKFNTSLLVKDPNMVLKMMQNKTGFSESSGPPSAANTQPITLSTSTIINQVSMDKRMDHSTLALRSPSSPIQDDPSNSLSSKSISTSTTATATTTATTSSPYSPSSFTLQSASASSPTFLARFGPTLSFSKSLPTRESNRKFLLNFLDQVDLESGRQMGSLEMRHLVFGTSFFEDNSIKPQCLASGLTRLGSQFMRAPEVPLDVRQAEIARKYIMRQDRTRVASVHMIASGGPIITAPMESIRLLHYWRGERGAQTKLAKWIDTSAIAWSQLIADRIKRRRERSLLGYD